MLVFRERIPAPETPGSCVSSDEAHGARPRRRNLDADRRPRWLRRNAPGAGRPRRGVALLPARVRPGQVYRRSLRGDAAMRAAAIWMHHGMLTWGETASAAYSAAIDLITEAEEWLERQARKPVQVAVQTSQKLARERALQGCAGASRFVGGSHAPSRGPFESDHRSAGDGRGDPGSAGFAGRQGTGRRCHQWTATTCHKSNPPLVGGRAELRPIPPSCAVSFRTRLQHIPASMTAYYSRNAGDGVHPPDCCPRIVLLPGLGSAVRRSRPRNLEPGPRCGSLHLDRKGWHGRL